MRTTLRSLVLAGLLTVPAVAGAAPRGFAVGPPGAWVRPAPPIPGRASTEQAEGGVQYELVDHQRNLAHSPPQFFSRVRARVLNEAGLAEASLKTIDFDPSFETLTIHEARIERDGGSIRALDPDRVRVLRRETGLEQQVFDGTHTAVVTLDDVRVGDVVEYSYTRTGANPALVGHPDALLAMGFGRPVTCLELRVLWPADRPANVRSRRGTAEPIVTRADGVVEYRWPLRDVPANDFVPDLPAGYDPLPWAQVSSFPDWNALARWGAALYPAPGPVPAAVRAVADTIARRTSDPEQRTLLALRIVQEDVRYLADQLGEGAYRPRPTAEVLRRRFGDCKGKVALLLDLLRALGVQAEPAFVSTRFGRDLASFAPSPQLFDHVIACVTVGGRRHWLDATRQGQRGPRLEHRSAADGSWALVLAPGTRSLERMEPTVESRPETFIWKHIDSPAYTDTVRMTVVTEYRGLAAERTRHWLREGNVATWTESCLRFYRQHHEGIAKTRDVDATDVPDSNLVRITESYTITGFWTTDSTYGRYSADLSPVELASLLPPEPEPDREVPLGLAGPSLARCETWLVAPEAIGIRTARNVAASSFVRVSTRESADDRTVHLVHELETLAPMVPAESLAAYAEFVAPVAGMLDFGVQSAIGRAGRAASAGTNLPLLLVLLASLAAGATLVVRGSRVDPPGWWTRRVSTQAAAPDAVAAPGAEGTPDAEPVPVAPPAEPPRIGGWLILPGIGLVLSPFRIAWESRELLSLLDQAVWNANLEASGAARGMKQFILLFEMCGNALLFAMSVWTLLEFFRRRRLFPLLFIVTSGAAVALVFGDLVLGSMIDPWTPPATDDLGGLVRSLAVFAIWSVYMLQSDRVRRTFVR